MNPVVQTSGAPAPPPAPPAEPPPAPGRLRRVLGSVWVRAAVTLAMLALVASKIDWSAARDATARRAAAVARRRRRPRRRGTRRRRAALVAAAGARRRAPRRPGSWAASTPSRPSPARSCRRRSAATWRARCWSPATGPARARRADGRRRPRRRRSPGCSGSRGPALAARPRRRAGRHRARLLALGRSRRSWAVVAVAGRRGVASAADPRPACSSACAARSATSRAILAHLRAAARCADHALATSVVFQGLSPPAVR